MAKQKQRTALTAIKVANAQPRRDPQGRKIRSEVGDAQQPGLRLCIHPSGTKNWVIRYRRRGDRKSRKLTLPFLPLARAREEARAVMAQVAEGGDPAGERRQAKSHTRQADLFEEVCRDFLTTHVRTSRGTPIRDSTRKEYGRMLGFKVSGDAWVPTGGGLVAFWRGRLVQSITRRDVMDVLDDFVAQRGPVAANRYLATLRLVLRWRVHRDPETLARAVTDGIPDPAPETSRSRVLSDAELAALWKVCEREGYPIGPLVQLLILVGARRDELRCATWPEFDLAARVWVLPGHRAKNGREHVVPLSDAAIALLQGLPRIGTRGWVFTRSGERPVTDLTRSKARLDLALAAELGHEPPHWTIHDLRRTFVSGLQRLAFSIEVCEACVNHRGGTLAGVSGIYARHSYAQEKAMAFATWARHVQGLVSGTTGSVVPFVVRA